MEEKQEKQVENAHSCEGACHTGGKCMDMHKFCFARCCVWKCIAVIFVLAVVFSLGFCAGHRDGYGYERGSRSYGSQYGLRYGGGMMDPYFYQDYGRNMMYRGVPSVTVSTGPVDAIPQ